jgi:hypothetical protein
MWKMIQAVDLRSHVTYSCYVTLKLCVIMGKDGENDPGSDFMFTCDVGFICYTICV